MANCRLYAGISSHKTAFFLIEGTRKLKSKESVSGIKEREKKKVNSLDI